MAKQLMLIAMLALTCCHLASSSDPSPLGDFCVPDCSSSEIVNGKACKDPKDVQAEDVFFSGLDIAANTSNPNGFKANVLTVEQIPGLNTLGISMARLDFEAYGVNPPHTHPRATEILTVLEGSLEVGFVTSNPENRHIYKTLNKGDVFVFPIGLVHYQRNVNDCNDVALVGLSSQSPGVISIPSAVFGSSPNINTDILAKAFRVENTVIDQMQSKLYSYQQQDIW